MIRTIRKGEEAKRGRGAIFALLFVVVAFAAGCGANDGILKSGKETPGSSNAQPRKSAFEEDLGSMRTADFRFIYVLRRKDGGKIDAEDRSVIKAQTTDANRRVSSDDDKAFILGTNTQIPPNNLMALYKHFAVEDYSPPQPPTNTNANANK